MPTREELELRKLELEIRDLSRPPWLRAVYIAALLPAILAVLTFLSAWMSGYFDRERTQLRQEIIQLRADRNALKAEALPLKVSVDALMDMLQRSTERIEQDNVFIEKIATILGARPTPTPNATASPQR